MTSPWGIGGVDATTVTSSWCSADMDNHGDDVITCMTEVSSSLKISTTRSAPAWPSEENRVMAHAVTTIVFLYNSISIVTTNRTTIVLARKVC
jgi:hypothetical protein